MHGLLWRRVLISSCSDNTSSSRPTPVLIRSSGSMETTTPSLMWAFKMQSLLLPQLHMQLVYTVVSLSCLAIKSWDNLLSFYLPLEKPDFPIWISVGLATQPLTSPRPSCGLFDHAVIINTWLLGVNTFKMLTTNLVLNLAVVWQLIPLPILEHKPSFCSLPRNLADKGKPGNLATVDGCSRRCYKL